METKEGTFTQACKLVLCFIALGALKMTENVALFRYIYTSINLKFKYKTLKHLQISTVSLKTMHSHSNIVFHY